METVKKEIRVEITVQAPIEKVWEYWNKPEHITKWYFASDDWHAPSAENDLKPGGILKIRMEAKDGSFGFDLVGNYTTIIFLNLIEYTMEDERKVKIIFLSKGDITEVIETFDAENQHSLELQRQGWQNILDNFKKYVESV